MQGLTADRHNAITGICEASAEEKRRARDYLDTAGMRAMLGPEDDEGVAAGDAACGKHLGIQTSKNNNTIANNKQQTQHHTQHTQQHKL